MAFDGTTLVQWTHLEGKVRLLITTLTSPPRTISQRVRNPDGHYAYPPFAVHGRVAYFVAFPRVPGSVAAEDIPPSRLMALDLSSEEGRAHLLLEIPGLRRPRGILNNVPRWPHRIAKKGLWFWLDKDTWTLVPWLKSWPNED